MFGHRSRLLLVLWGHQSDLAVQLRPLRDIVINVDRDDVTHDALDGRVIIRNLRLCPHDPAVARHTGSDIGKRRQECVVVSLVGIEAGNAARQVRTAAEQDDLRSLRADMVGDPPRRQVVH